MIKAPPTLRDRLARYLASRGPHAARDLARELEVERSAVYHWLRGTRRPAGRNRRILLALLSHWEGVG